MLYEVITHFNQFLAKVETIALKAQHQADETEKAKKHIETEMRVITSYSIHYTKLYDLSASSSVPLT